MMLKLVYVIRAERREGDFVDLSDYYSQNFSTLAEAKKAAKELEKETNFIVSISVIDTSDL